MSSHKGEHIPLSVLLKRELANEKVEKPDIISGQANQSKKGEDFTLIKSECQRVLGDGVTTYSVFGVITDECISFLFAFILYLVTLSEFKSIVILLNFCFQVLDGHNGSAAAIYTKENLLNNVLSAIPPDLNRDEWIAALPRALVAGFVKTDKDYQEKGIEFRLSKLLNFLVYAFIVSLV